MFAVLCVYQNLLSPLFQSDRIMLKWFFQDYVLKFHIFSLIIWKQNGQQPVSNSMRNYSKSCRFFTLYSIENKEVSVFCRTETYLPKSDFQTGICTKLLDFRDLVFLFGWALEILHSIPRLTWFITLVSVRLHPLEKFQRGPLCKLSATKNRLVSREPVESAWYSVLWSSCFLMQWYRLLLQGNFWVDWHSVSREIPD